MSTLMLLGIMLIFIVLMMFTSSRTRKKQRQEREAMMSELQEGVWVKTIGRMYGRIVDIDDEVVVLESLDGTELLFSRDAIASVSEPRFSSDEEAADVETDEAFTDYSADTGATEADDKRDGGVIKDYNRD